MVNSTRVLVACLKKSFFLFYVTSGTTSSLGIPGTVFMQDGKDISVSHGGDICLSSTDSFSLPVGFSRGTPSSDSIII